MSEQTIEFEKSPYRFVSDNAKKVGTEIEKMLVGFTIKEAQETLQCVIRAVAQNNKVLSV